MALSEYEQKALRACEAHRRKMLAKSPRRIMPTKVRRAGSHGWDRAKDVPGFGRANAATAKAFATAAGGLGRVLSRVTHVTLSPDRVQRAYRKAGHPIEDLSEVRSLDLSVVDRVSPLRELKNRYALGMGAEGMVTPFVLTGGEFAVAASGGVAAAPTLGATAAAMAADMAAVLEGATHVVAHTALYYGYDHRRPEEELFTMSIIGAGTAATQSAKAASYAELARLTQLLVRGAPWSQLNQQLLPLVAGKFAEAFGHRLTKQKLGQFVPIAGIALGAGLNYAMIDKVADAANWAYRERFLREKLGEDGVTLSDPAPSLPEDSSDEDAIEVLSLLDQVAAEEGVGAAGIPVLPSVEGHIITTEMVEAALDED